MAELRKIPEVEAELAVRRRMTESDRTCINFVELPFMPPYVGERNCGRVISWLFGYDYNCNAFLCPELNDAGHGHLGVNLCPFQHMCSAACGFCQNPSGGNLIPNGATIDVAVQESDANIPLYRDVVFVAGTTYRFRAWEGENISAVILILVDPTGYPIRRAITDTGSTLDRPQNVLDLQELGVSI